MSKLVLVLILLAVLTSLGLALFYLVHDRGNTERTVRALTWRTLLSIALFALLLIGAAVGLIGPREVPQPQSSEAPAPSGSPPGIDANR